jgi:FkbM family methyltransferase
VAEGSVTDETQKPDAGPLPADLNVDRLARPIADLVQTVLMADDRFAILDGGAGSAYDDARWKALSNDRIRYYGFVLDADECATMNRDAQTKGLPYTYYPMGLWSCEATLPFHENKSPGGSSFYVQNTTLTDRWKFEDAKNFFLSKEIFRPTRTVEAKLTTIAQWAATQGIAQVDFLKLNVQGAELEILKGAGGLLDGVLGVQAEVSFVESYLGRPMFSDIDPFMRAHGFEFCDLIGPHYMGRARSPLTAQHRGFGAQVGQVIEAHAVYLRDPIADEAKGRPLDHFPVKQILKLAAFAEMYRDPEYGFELLEWCRERLAAQGQTQLGQLIEQVRDEALRRYTILYPPSASSGQAT